MNKDKYVCGDVVIVNNEYFDHIDALTFRAIIIEKRPEDKTRIYRAKILDKLLIDRTLPNEIYIDDMDIESKVV